MWPRSAYEKVGGWNEALSRNDDGDIVMRALAQGIRIVETSEGEVFYRRHDKSRVSVSRMRASESHLRSAAQVLADLAINLQSQNRLSGYSRAIVEDMSEVATLAFRARLNGLGKEVVRMARALGDGRLYAPEAAAAAVASREDDTAAMLDRVWALATRAGGQLRRWTKRRAA